MSLLLASAVDWTNVLVALIAGLPAIIAAVGVVRVNSKIKTPSGKQIGAQMEDTLHTVLSNNYHLQSVGKKLGAETPPQANGEAAKVKALVEDHHADPRHAEPKAGE